MLLKNKKVLVTGAGGFIGSHLVETLIRKVAKVKAMVKYNSRGDWGMLSDLPSELQRSTEVISGDIRDPFFVRKAVEGCDCVFHLAALIGIPYSYVAPSDYVSVNVSGTVNILQACLDEGIPHLVHTSTSEVYGTAQYVPIDENHPLQGQSPYSASKIAADKMAESYNKSFGLPVVTVRPFNTFGPRQSARAFIPTVIVQALTTDRLKLGSLEPIRDLTYVEDTAEGLVTAGLCDNLVGKVVNLGVGKGYSMEIIVREILKVLGRNDMRIQKDASRVRPENSEVMRLISNNKLARETCRWEPKYDLEQGVSKTIEWFRHNLHRYRPEAYAV